MSITKFRGAAKLLTREQILDLAKRCGGFSVHIYKYSAERNRKLCRRLRREGLLVMERRNDVFIYSTKTSQALATKESI